MYRVHAGDTLFSIAERFGTTVRALARANRLDRDLDWDEVAAIAEDAYAEVAPAKLVEAALAPPGEHR